MNAHAAAWHRRLGWLTVGHALLVVIVSVAMFHVDSLLILIRPWLILAWGWLAWPLVLMRHPGRSVIETVLPLAIGLVLLAPCVPYLLALTAISILGFAP